MQLSSSIEEADQGHCKCVHILKVPGQKGGVLCPIGGQTRSRPEVTGPVHF
jgi:hypothetical protein